MFKILNLGRSRSSWKGNYKLTFVFFYGIKGFLELIYTSIKMNFFL